MAPPHRLRLPRSTHSLSDLVTANLRGSDCCGACAAGGFHRPSSKWRKHSFIRASDVEEGLRIGATWVFGGLIHWLPDVASLAHDLSTALSRPTTAEL